MTEAETKKILYLLLQYYPNKKLTQKQCLAWCYALDVYDYSEVRAAAIAYARKNKFFPDLADITKDLRDSDAKCANAGMHELEAVRIAQRLAKEIRQKKLDEKELGTDDV